MGRNAFVGWLFITAVACLLAGVAGRSFGWFTGGVVLISVAIYARRQLKDEKQVGRKNASGVFLVSAFSILILAMYILMRLDTHA